MKTQLISRRSFLKGTLAAGGLLAAGGVWRAADSGVFSTSEGPAYAAWTNWEAGPKGPESLIRAAILAANAHNSQPWRFRLGDASVDVFADPGRSIGSADPFLREMRISLGCALENLILAAQANGYSVQTSYFPNKQDDRHAANITLAPSQPVRTDLYDAIPHRHMNRGPYEKNRPVPQDLIQSFHDLNTERSDIRLFVFDGPQDKLKIAGGMVEATEAFIADKQQTEDSAKWSRPRWKDIETHKDGITNDSQGLSAFTRFIVKMLPPLSQEQSDKYWLDAVKNKQTATAAAFGFIAVRNLDDHEQIVKAGQLWQRLHLQAMAKGVGMHILNQMSERRDRELFLNAAPVFGDKLRGILGGGDWHSVIQFRMGYPTVEPLPSPRRPVQEVLV